MVLVICTKYVQVVSDEYARTFTLATTTNETYSLCLKMIAILILLQVKQS